MRRPVRLLLAGLLVATPAVAGCSVVHGDAEAAGPTVVATAEAGMTRVDLDHRSGEDPGPVPRVIVPRGSTVVLTVGSDVARRVLIPEQGRAVDVTAGSTVTVRFLALGNASVRVAEPGTDRGGTVIGRIEPRH
ncbi:hypothetical protein WIS52_11050 [Pseudonocardia nematodicida]|uniref:Uncharacterized protein n=1 Tax=Pseudonocardia nematodicida TaxID=1206997 RepID=A0ABV1K956_9PSEU